MKTARFALLALGLSLTLALPACKSNDKAGAQASSEAAAVTPVNTICPIGGHDADATLTSSYKGKTIAFCCDGCKSDFDGGDTARKDEVLGRALANKAE